LFGLDGRGLWLNSLLLNVSLPSVCGIFRIGFSDSLIHLNARETIPEDVARRWKQNIEQKKIQPWTMDNRVPQ
jgi:hypothetical protein